MTDRSDKTRSPAPNELANLYAAEAEYEEYLADVQARELEYINVLIKIRAAIKRANGDSGAKV